MNEQNKKVANKYEKNSVYGEGVDNDDNVSVSGKEILV